MICFITKTLTCLLLLIAGIPSALLGASNDQTIGGGTLDQPAVGPPPTIKVEGARFTLVKNWDFGTNRNSTVHNMNELSDNFQYHDQFNTISNGTNYGAVIVAPDEAHALAELHQPIEGTDTSNKPTRAFQADCLRTFLVPLHNTATVDPKKHNAGCGSFQAIWRLPKGGSLLGQDVLWETRVRYDPPPYFWYSIWTCGNKWQKGAEIDLIESFGYDNGGGHTNFDGQFWHIGCVGGTDANQYKNWQKSMAEFGIQTFNAAQWHTWSMLYRTDDTYTAYMDGIIAQTGKLKWTLAAKEDGEPLDMSFTFDAGWGHTKVKSVNHPLPATAFEGKYFDWDYSRVYLRPQVH